jgi:hypothetical protein
MPPWRFSFKQRLTFHVFANPLAHFVGNVKDLSIFYFKFGKHAICYDFAIVYHNLNQSIGD